MWSDRETVDDCLGFAQYVRSLADVCLEESIAPLTLGVFGSWGRGKTSLMKMLQKELDAQTGQGVRTLWFNAWRYEGKDEIQSALINAILLKVRENQPLSQEVKDLLKRLRDGASVLKLAKFIGKTAITLTPDIQGFLDCFNEESEKVVDTMATFERDFEKYLQELKVSRVAVFIDDLDRCQSQKIVETFETIKLFLNIPGCTFVLGADDAKIRQAIIETYRETYRVSDQSESAFSDDYLEKIVQIPFSIPEQRLDDIRCYVSMLFLKKELTPDGWSALLAERPALLSNLRAGSAPFAQWVRDNAKWCSRGADAAVSRLAEIEPYIDILARGLRGNPRQIKRCLNILSLRQRLADANGLAIRPDTLIKLLVIEYVWRPFFLDLVETTDPATGHSGLLKELLTVARGADMPTDSPALKAAMDAPGLREFLLNAPVVEGDTDLGPYLFLSQTALAADRPAAIRTAEEMARSLATRIGSDDRIRSRAAVLHALRQDTVVADAVIRELCTAFLGLSDPRRQVNALGGLIELCRIRPSTYSAVVDLLGGLDPKANQALALPAMTFLENAETAGVGSAGAIRKKFAGSSKILGALGRDSGPRN